MKTRNIVKTFLSCAVAATLLTACGGNGTETTAPAASQQAGDAVTDSITITGNDRMQFDITEFTVAAGSEVTVVFKNIGRMPKETMGHNLVILDKSVDANAFANASMRHGDNEYVAPDFEDRVIAATKVLGPGQEETLTFTAPDEPGDFPFVCSFPGHTPAGMRGIMKVE